MSDEQKAPPAMCRDFGDLSVRVELPELVGYEGEMTEAMVDRAADALWSAIDQMSEVYLDGEEAPPTRVYIDKWNLDEFDEWRIE